MATVRGGPVKAHAQAFCDAVASVAGLNGATDFGTRSDHQPTRDRAVDIFVPTNSRTKGDAICDFAIANYRRYGVDYVIYHRRIWNPEISPNWRTYNGASPHIDHVHVSFDLTAPALPTPAPQEDDMTPDEHKTLYEAKDRAEDARVAAVESRDAVKALAKRVEEIASKLK